MSHNDLVVFDFSRVGSSNIHYLVCLCRQHKKFGIARAFTGKDTSQPHFLDLEKKNSCMFLIGKEAGHTPFGFGYEGCLHLNIKKNYSTSI